MWQLIISSDNGLAPNIIWTNAWILLTRISGINFSEFLSEFHTFSFKKKRLKVSSAKWRPFHLGLNVLTLLQLKLYYSALPIYRSHFFPITHERHPWLARKGEVWVSFLEFQFWPKVYLRICSAVCIIVLYCTAIYRESILFARNIALCLPLKWVSGTCAISVSNTVFFAPQNKTKV